MPISTRKPRLSRSAKTTKLPLVIAHELDVIRAASMGVDISHMMPEQRCKYPSKFCCNPRARKSTGTLHRFCEDHRSRANVNQKRWAEVRRRHESTGAAIATSTDIATGVEDLARPYALPEDLMASASSDLSEDEVDMLLAILLHEEPRSVPAPHMSEQCGVGFMSLLIGAEIPSDTKWFGA